MEIYYNSVGMPFLIKNGIVYEFSQTNSSEIVPEISLNVDVFFSIKTNLINKIKSVGEELSKINNDDDIVKISQKIQNLINIPQLNGTIGILSEAEDIQYQIINPQPYNSWRWDRLEKKWLPPIDRPINVSEDDAIWDELTGTWKPSSPQPYDGWVWSWENKSWEPPIAYPIGAEENEFIWSKEFGTWVLNDQVG